MHDEAEDREEAGGCAEGGAWREERGGGEGGGGGAAAIMHSAAACAAALSAASTMSATSSAEALVGDGDVGLYDILPLHLLDLHDVEYMTLLYKLLQRSQHVVRFYLGERVFHPPRALVLPRRHHAFGRERARASVCSGIRISA